MKVLMVSTSYPRDAQDWQGRFIHDMAGHVAAQEGVDLSLWAPPGELPPGVAHAASAHEWEWLGSMAARGGIAQILRRKPVTGLLTAARLVAYQWRAYRRACADLVHVNWMQNALALGRSPMPALITVLGSDMRLLQLPGMRYALRAMLVARRAVLAPNAEWMAEPLHERFGDLAQVRPVPFGVEGAWFGVVRKPVLAGGAEWIVVSRITRDKIGDLLTWGKGLFGEQRQLHLFGPMQDALPLPGWISYHGPTHPAALLREWFPRAAGLITLSRHDEGRPQVMLEAMAAGVPVVASDHPAHRDLVRDGESGFIVSTRDEFAAAVNRLEGEEENLRISIAARTWIRERIGTWDDCAVRYVALYRELLQD